MLSYKFQGTFITKVFAALLFIFTTLLTFGPGDRSIGINKILNKTHSLISCLPVHDLKPNWLLTLLAPNVGQAKG